MPINPPLAQLLRRPCCRFIAALLILGAFVLGVLALRQFFVHGEQQALLLAILCHTAWIIMLTLLVRTQFEHNAPADDDLALHAQHRP